MQNKDIANLFYTVADMYEIKGENIFKINAFRKVARVIENFTEELADLKDNLPQLPGVGKGLHQRILQIINTGTCDDYEKLKQEIPAGLLEILSIQGVGPKTVQALYKELKITTVDQLEEFAKKGELKKLFRMGDKTEENIIKGIVLLKEGQKKLPFYEAEEIAENFIYQLKQFSQVKKISVAGSLRRLKETIGDIDILVVAKNVEKVMDYFTQLPEVKQILAKGKTKSSIITKFNLQIDLRVVKEKSWGAALQYFTGSKEHNVALRELAQKQKLKISEYGVFDEKDKYLCGKTEEEVYKKVGLQFIPPELRENQGEIAAAQKNNLPQLIELKDLKGDFHIHSNWSDGSFTLEELVLEARKLGHQYIAITDHSQSLHIAKGLTPERLKQQAEEIKKLNEKYKDIVLLSGIEVDILADGNLDLPLEILKELDIVVASVHSKFKMTKEEMTTRIIKAIESGVVDVIGHLSGRLIRHREASEINLDEIFKAAVKNNVALEINSYPERLDLKDTYCKYAQELGVKFVISTDAHQKGQLNFLRYGINVARRGWIKKENVINTRGIKEFKVWKKTKK